MKQQKNKPIKHALTARSNLRSWPLAKNLFSQPSHFHIIKLMYLLTRPRIQAQSLQHLCQQAKINYECLPCIIIEAIAYTFKTQYYNKLLFTSANGVQAFDCTRISNEQVFAIGPATRDALVMHNVTVEPLAYDFNSEALLQLNALQQVRAQKIAIIGGENPRPLLTQRLTERGAEVNFIATYKRLCPAPLTARQLQHLREQPYSAIIVTSLAGLKNLYVLCAPIKDWLLSQKLIVVRDTQRDYALKNGHHGKISLAQNASNHAIMQVIEAERAHDGSSQP